MDNINPRVSIGLPVYNGERYLADAIDSILAQTYINFELIISDNASDDRTGKICMEYAAQDQRVRYYRNETNLGVAPNHNAVFKLAKGEYFRWAGYDDKIAPEFLEKCVKFLDDHPDVILCVPGAEMIGEHGERLENYEYLRTYSSEISSPISHKRFCYFALANISGNYMYGLIRTSSVAQTSLHGSYPSSDLVFFSELALIGKFEVMPDCLFYRRIHPAKSTMGAFAKERNRAVLFDTSNIGRILLPKWQILVGYLKAIWRSKIDVRTKLICNYYMIAWILKRENFRSLVKDIILAGQKVISRLY